MSYDEELIDVWRLMRGACGNDRPTTEQEYDLLLYRACAALLANGYGDRSLTLIFRIVDALQLRPRWRNTKHTPLEHLLTATVGMTDDDANEMLGLLEVLQEGR